MFLGETTGLAHGWDLGRPSRGGGTVIQEEWNVRQVEADEGDPIASRLWHSGRRLHTCAGIGEGHTVLNVCVAYGIPANAPLNTEFWELVICSLSRLGASPCLLFTDANFNFDVFHKIPAAPLTALAYGWLVDPDHVFATLHQKSCVSNFSKDGAPGTRMDALLATPAQVSALVDVSAVQGHSLQGHTPVRYTFALNGPTQNVIRMRKLPPFSLPPREVEEAQEISDMLLKPSERKWAALVSEGDVNAIWDQWTWLAEEVGLALSCNHLTKDSLGAALPFTPKSAPRGRGTAQMLRETTLAPSKTTAYGGHELG